MRWTMPADAGCANAILVGPTSTVDGSGKLQSTTGQATEGSCDTAGPESGTVYAKLTPGTWYAQVVSVSYAPEASYYSNVLAFQVAPTKEEPRHEEPRPGLQGSLGACAARSDRLLGSALPDLAIAASVDCNPADLNPSEGEAFVCHATAGPWGAAGTIEKIQAGATTHGFHGAGDCVVVGPHTPVTVTTKDGRCKLITDPDNQSKKTVHWITRKQVDDEGPGGVYYTLQQSCPVRQVAAGPTKITAKKGDGLFGAEQKGNKTQVFNFGNGLQVADHGHQFNLGLGEEIIGGPHGFVGKPKKFKCSAIQKRWYPKECAALNRH